MKRAWTMIELIFVIIILGILAITVLPKFMGVQSDAKIAAEKGTVGAIRAGIALAHSKWLLREEDSFDWDNDGVKEEFSSNGYLKNLETGGAYDNSAASTNIFSEILSTSADDWHRTNEGDGSTTIVYEGPASKDDSGVDSNGDGNDINSSGKWTYDITTGEFTYGK